MSSQPSKNHHWLPQCLMRPWEGEDSLVESISMQPWGLSARRKSTKALGSEHNLHRIGLLKEPNIFESIFADVESEFSRSKWKALNEGIAALKSYERDSFAFFVALLANRQADRVKDVAGEAGDSLARRLRDKLPAMDPCEAGRIKQGYGTYIALRAVMEFTAGLYPDIAGLEWRILDFSGVSLKLVLADRPLRAWGDDGKIARLILPLGPDHLFVAGKFPAAEEIIFGKQFRELLAVQVVSQQFWQASNFVVACTREPYLALAENILKSSNRTPLER